jgi:hypothetical protein
VTVVYSEKELDNLWVWWWSHDTGFDKIVLYWGYTTDPIEGTWNKIREYFKEALIIPVLNEQSGVVITEVD